MELEKVKKIFSLRGLNKFKKIKIMTAAPKDFELNIPAVAPKTVADTEVNLLNWRNWLATVIAVGLVLVAANYSFMSLNAREKFVKSMVQKLS